MHVYNVHIEHGLQEGAFPLYSIGHVIFTVRPCFFLFPLFPLFNVKMFVTENISSAL